MSSDAPQFVPPEAKPRFIINNLHPISTADCAAELTANASGVTHAEVVFHLLTLAHKLAATPSATFPTEAEMRAAAATQAPAAAEEGASVD